MPPGSSPPVLSAPPPPPPARRYANEELRLRALSIAAAAEAEEPGIGRGRVAQLGACMADLIASDFEALEAAGLRCAGRDRRKKGRVALL